MTPAPSDSQLLRGTVWHFNFEEGAPPKPAVIVSNNRRNCTIFPYVHVVRITTVPKDQRDTIVPLLQHETLQGRVMCDDLQIVYKNELGKHLGTLTIATMRQIDQALKIVLALP